MKELKINEKIVIWATLMGQTLIINSRPHILHNIMYHEKGKNWDEGKHSVVIVPKAKAKFQKPKLYRVLLLNDDYTPMDFVIFVLKNFFKKNFTEAMRIMLNVHHNGIGECGTYTYEVAEMKIVQVRECARQNEHPLQCVMEWK